MKVVVEQPFGALERDSGSVTSSERRSKLSGISFFGHDVSLKPQLPSCTTVIG